MDTGNDYAWEGMPLCSHGYQFDCEQCARDKEPKYEHIDITIAVPTEGESWYDRIFDFIESQLPECTYDETGECSCIQSMGGCTGTMDQVLDYERFSEKWAVDVLAADLKLAVELIRIYSPSASEEDWYKRLCKAAYYHEDFRAWLDSLPDDDEEEEE